MYQLIETENEKWIAKSKAGEIKAISKDRLPGFAKKGDFVRHVEHGYYDVVDRDGNPIFRNM